MEWPNLFVFIVRFEMCKQENIANVIFEYMAAPSGHNVILLWEGCCSVNLIIILAGHGKSKHSNLTKDLPENHKQLAQKDLLTIIVQRGPRQINKKSFM